LLVDSSPLLIPVPQAVCIRSCCRQAADNGTLAVPFHGVESTEWAGRKTDQGGAMATIVLKANVPGETTDDDTGTAWTVSPRTAAAFSGGVTAELARWFKLLADETRLRILLFLIEQRELNVRSLCEVLNLSQPAVSHHLALLRADGLVDCRRDGKHNYYRLLPQRFGELIGKIVEAVPGDEQALRVGNVSLSVMTRDEQPSAEQSG
jgi:ArsR family transcriptional regulator